MNFILAHFIGDFLFQTDWMARNKKHNFYICFVHVMCYMIPFLFVDINWLQFFLIAVQHFLQDKTNFIKWYCKTFGIFQGELKQKILPWGHFIIDQIFHFVWIYYVIYFL